MKTFLILSCLWLVVGCSAITKNQATVKSTTTEVTDSQRQNGPVNLTKEQAIVFRQELARLETILNEDVVGAVPAVTSQHELFLQEVRRQVANRAIRIRYALETAQQTVSGAARLDALRQEAIRANSNLAAQPAVSRQEAQRQVVLRLEAMQAVRNEARLGADLEAALEAAQPVVAKQEVTQ